MEKPRNILDDFDPANFTETPEERIAKLMQQMPDTPDVTAPEHDPLKEDYKPADMQEIIRVMVEEGGYKDIDAANRAIRIMFSQSHDMLRNFDNINKVIGGVQEAANKTKAKADKATTESQSIALAMRELCALIMEGGNEIDVKTAAARCAQIAEAATTDIQEYEGNMLNIAVNLRALNDKKGPLRGLGNAPREQVLYLVNAAAAVLDDARVNMLALKEAAQGLMEETSHLREQLETVNAVADKPEVLN